MKLDIKKPAGVVTCEAFAWIILFDMFAGQVTFFIEATKLLAQLLSLISGDVHYV